MPPCLSPLPRILHGVRIAASCALFAGILIPAGRTQSSREWHPVPGRITTPWTANVGPENAWSQYPRPQFVREAWQSLNGLWDYAILPKASPAPTSFDGKILVPFAVESSLSGVGRTLTPDNRLWYRRSFTIPDSWKGQRLLLHFEAVDYESALWVNGILIGSHAGGFDPFSFDITDYVRTGANELVLRVGNPVTTGEQPRGKQTLAPSGIYYTAVSGIWQTAWIEPVPATNGLRELRYRTDLKRGCVWVSALSDPAVQDPTLAVKLTALAGGHTVATAIIRANREGRLDLPNPHAWSPEDPFLYDLTAEVIRVKPPASEIPSKEKARQKGPHFGEAERVAYAQAEIDGPPLDRVTSYFALRDLSVGKIPGSGQPRLMLNGAPYFETGPLDQGWWPDGLMTPPSDEAVIWELKWLKQAGFNMLRKHIKEESSRYYYQCDRLGLLVWQDMPSGYLGGNRTARNDEGEPPRLSVSREQFELELRKMVDRLGNHPCIASWVVFNEGWGQYETAALANWVKSIDPSRVINAASGWLDRGVGEVFDLHNYDVVPARPKADADRAIVIGEYGGVGWPVSGHLWNPESRNWGYQTYQDQDTYVKAVLKKLSAIAAMRRDIGLSAAVYTQTSDVEGEVNGLMTYDRKFVKIPVEILAEANRAICRNASAAGSP